MWVPQAPLVVFFIISSIHISCSEKGSLVYVIDTTGSMADDIAQVKQSTKKITKTVFEEKASQIKNMMIVKFNDPDAYLDILTENRYTYESKLDRLSIVEYSGGDCPEMSMKGLSIALEKSLPGSFIYLFTDASAKDHYKKDNITKMCQEKKSQIMFVLTGRCHEDYWLPPFQVYYEIAAACSGLAINVKKNEVSGIFDPIRDAIKDSKEVITSKSIPANTRQLISFEINDQTDYATVTVAGDNVFLSINGPSLIPTHKVENIAWLSNFKVLKLTNLTPGTYTADVGSASVTTIKIVAKSDFSFQYGFSELQSTTLKDTTAQPTADSSTHLLVSVSDPYRSVNILSAQILDINENIIVSNMTLKRISKNLYSTTTFVAPSHTFKIAVLGSAISTGKSIRHLGRFPITPQPGKKKPVVTISEGTTVEVEYGKYLKLTCKVTAFPEPKIQWMNGFGIVTSETSVTKPPYQYTSYLIIAEASESRTYFCNANNEVGNDKRQIEVNVKDPFEFNTPFKDVVEIKYGDRGTLECDIKSSQPMYITWIFKSKNSNFRQQIGSSNKYSLSADNTVLTINRMSLDMIGTYTCTAILKRNRNKFISHSTQVKLIGLSLPKITSNTSAVYRSIEGYDKALRIPCTATGTPKPTISWTVRRKTITPSLKYAIEDDFLVIRTPTVDDTATYVCQATNDAGSVTASFHAQILQAPQLSGEVSKRVRVGTSTNIICNIAKGVPAPTILWQFMAKGESKFVQIAGSGNELHIPKVDEGDAGSYKCVAHNEVGDAEHIIALVVEFAPYITSNNHSTSYEVIEGDLALKMPCLARGVPTPVISWLCNDTDITTEPRYSILSNGALIIKDPKKKDTGSYICVATNTIGSARATFEAEVKQHIDDYGPIDELFIDVTKQSSYRLECGSPGQSVKWFTENLGEANVTGNYYELNNIEDSFETNLTCHVSDVNGSYTKTFVVVGSKPPKFQYEQQGTIFDWTGSDKDLLDCTLSDGDHTDVEWTYNGKKLSEHKSLTLAVEGKWGAYTCNVRNHFGTVQRSFTVVSSLCLISRNPKRYEAMPLILNEKSTWPKLNSNKDYFKIEPGTKLSLACPKNEAATNNMKMFPTSNEITAICDKQDIFTVEGKPYKISDLECDHPVTPSVINEKVQCAGGPTESLRVGYNTSTSNFLQTYQVCFDTTKNLPIYSVEWIPDSNNERNVEYNWYKHPAVEFSSNDNLYTCENSTSNCCYKKAQLISTRAFSDSVAQTSTFIDPINAVPLWLPCDEYQSPWDLIDKTIRRKLTRSPVSAIWSGIRMGRQQNGFDAPRYLFKLVEFLKKKPIAIVYVNGPSPTEEDVLCKSTFGKDEVSGLKVLSDHVYLCDGEEFRKALKFNHHKHHITTEQ